MHATTPKRIAALAKAFHTLVLVSGLVSWNGVYTR